MEETISRMAGAEWGIEMTPDQFDDAIRAIGRTPVGPHHDLRARRTRRAHARIVKVPRPLSVKLP